MLAFEATKLCRGEAAAEEAAAAAYVLFEDNTDGLDGLPTIEIDRAEIGEGISILDLLRRANLVMSKGEARRLIRGGGARLNDNRVRDVELMVNAKDLQDGALKLSSGKKRHIRVLAI